MSKQTRFSTRIEHLEISAIAKYISEESGLQFSVVDRELRRSCEDFYKTIEASFYGVCVRGQGTEIAQLAEDKTIMKYLIHLEYCSPIQKIDFGYCKNILEQSRIRLS